MKNSLPNFSADLAARSVGVLSLDPFAHRLPGIVAIPDLPLGMLFAPGQNLGAQTVPLEDTDVGGHLVFDMENRLADPSVHAVVPNRIEVKPGVRPGGRVDGDVPLTRFPFPIVIEVLNALAVEVVVAFTAYGTRLVQDGRSK